MYYPSGETDTGAEESHKSGRISQELEELSQSRGFAKPETTTDESWRHDMMQQLAAMRSDIDQMRSSFSTVAESGRLARPGGAAG